MSKRRRIRLAELSTYRNGPDKPVTLARIYRGDARRVMVGKIMDVLRDWRLSPFEFEGSTRAGMRAALVTDGHGWEKADDEAASILEECFRLMGAKRPTWLQGQPEYAAGREYCIGCRGPLDAEAIANGWRFCCHECASTTRNNRPEIYAFASQMARHASYYAAAKASIPERECAWCGTMFRPAVVETIACSAKCAGRIRTDAIPERDCLACGKRFRGRSKESRFCSTKCIRVHDRKTLPKRKCELCGDLFQPATTFNRFCSEAHRARANHLKRKGKTAPESAPPAAVVRPSAFVCEECPPMREAA